MIQCKDYNIDNPYQIEKQEIIDMEQYIDKFIEHYVWLDKECIQLRLFASNDTMLTQKAKDYCKESKKIKYRILNNENQDKFLQDYKVL